jgi:hypothetical protein
MDHLQVVKIIPGIGVGELRLGDPEWKVVQKMNLPIDRFVMPSGVTRMNFGSLQVWFNREYQVQQIGIYQGYNGETSEGIRVGISKEELKQIWGFGLAYNSDFEAYEFLNHPGILFEFAPNAFGVDYISVIYVVPL